LPHLISSFSFCSGVLLHGVGWELLLGDLGVCVTPIVLTLFYMDTRAAFSSPKRLAVLAFLRGYMGLL
jgi:hypothetical protein